MTCAENSVCVTTWGPVGASGYDCVPVPDGCAGGCPSCGCIGIEQCATEGYCAEQADGLDCGCGVCCCESRRGVKRDIAYVDDDGLQALHDEILRTRLATYRYKAEGAAARERLGFIIDDQEASPAVAADGHHVDLYAYASLAVAAVQVQARQIEALEREIEGLRAEMKRGKPRPR